MNAALERNAEAVAAYAGWAKVKTILERPVSPISNGTAFLDLDPDESGVEKLR